MIFKKTSFSHCNVLGSVTAIWFFHSSCPSWPSKTQWEYWDCEIVILNSLLNCITLDMINFKFKLFLKLVSYKFYRHSSEWSISVKKCWTLWNWNTGRPYTPYAYASSFFDNRACVELDMMVQVTCASKVKLHLPWWIGNAIAAFILLFEPMNDQSQGGNAYNCAEHDRGQYDRVEWVVLELVQ